MNEEKLRYKIEEAWWKVDARSPKAQQLMPTPKEHKNLLGDKQKYLDAVLQAVKEVIDETPICCEMCD